MAQHVALITSGATGLGHVTVQTMLEAGWDVHFTYRNSDDVATQLTAYAAQLGRKATVSHADLLQRGDVQRAVDEGLRLHGRVDALIHNFGPFVFERVTLADYTDAMWSRMIDGNLNNFFWLYQELIHGMRSRHFGRFITMGYDGAGAAVGWRHRAAYATAKAGLAVLTKSIASEEREFGITANMVCPGDIRGEAKMQMIRDVPGSADGLGRPPVGEDVSRLIRFLCEPHSQQVNGTVTEVTGGYDILAYEKTQRDHREV